MKHVKLFEAFEDEMELPESPMDAAEDMPAALPEPEEMEGEEGEEDVVDDVETVTEKDPVLDALDQFKSGKISGEEAADMIENSL